MSRFRIGLLVAGIAALLSAAGCGPTRPAAPASAPPPASVAEATPRERDAFLWIRNIDGFNAIDDQHIVVRGGVSKHALVTIFGHCFGLRDSETIVIDAPLPYLDKPGLGQIIYSQGLAGKARCPIDKIVAVKDLKEAKALVAAEKAEKTKTKAEGATSSPTSPQ